MRQELTRFAVSAVLLLFAMGCKTKDKGPEKMVEVISVDHQPKDFAHSNNPEMRAMHEAMLTFRNSLSGELLAKCSNDLDSPRFYQWHNTPAPSFREENAMSRDGIYYKDLSEEQLVHFKNVLKLFLSKKGYQKVHEITVLAEGFLSEIEPDFWNPDFYSIDLFGNPRNGGSWGFQLDGHHCAINFLVHGDNVSMVPAFIGGEPVRETYKGVSFDVFKAERELALKLYYDLTKEEHKHAVSNGKGKMQVGPARRQNGDDPHRGDFDYSKFKKGLSTNSLSEKTTANLRALMRAHIDNLSITFAERWWKDIEANFEQTYFVWVADTERPTAETQYYYRIYNPYLWVEFNMENPAERSLPNWNHVHTITRIPNNPETKNGGDYGIFADVINKNSMYTLYEHYALADHHKASELPFDYELSAYKEHVH